MEATVFLGTFNAAEMIWYPSTHLYRHNPISELYGRLGFCSDMHCQLWNLI